jgi:hypothetical protein
MSIESIVLDEMRVVAKEHNKRLPQLTEDLLLLESGLDSLCFAILMSRLEDITGRDPFVSISGSSYPRTVGDLIGLYDKVLA